MSASDRAARFGLGAAILVLLVCLTLLIGTSLTRSDQAASPASAVFPQAQRAH